MPSAHQIKRRNRLRPDNRPDWRDPDMPCWRVCKMSDGTSQALYISAELTQQFAKQGLECGAFGQEGWQEDPTYAMDRRRPRRG